MAAPTLQAEGSIAVVTTGNLSPTIPTHQADDVLVVVAAAWHPNTTTGANLMAAPAGWTKAASDSLITSSLFDGEWALFWRRATAAGTTVTLTRPSGWDTGTDGAWSARAYVIRGCAPTGDPWDAIAQSTLYSAANGSIPAVTVSGSERMVVQFLIASDDNGVGAGISGWTAGTRVSTTTGTDAEFQTYRQASVSSSTSSAASTVLARTAGRYLFVGASFRPDPTQSLTLPTISDGDTLHAPTVAPGPVDLTLPSLAGSPVLHVPTLTQAGADQALSLPALVGTSTLHAPSVAPGSVTLTLPVITDADTLHALSVAPGPVSLVLPSIVGTSTLHAPSVAPGAVTLTLPAISDGDTLHVPTLTQGGGTQSLTLPLLVGASTLHAMTVAPGPVSLTLPRIIAAEALHGPLVAPGPVSLALPHLEGSSTLHGPLVAPGAVSLTLPHLEDADALHAPVVFTLITLDLVGLEPVGAWWVAEVGGLLVATPATGWSAQPDALPFVTLLPSWSATPCA